MMGTQRLEGWKSLPVWLRYGVVILLVLGIFFRFYNLDQKVYWIDETNTSLRSLGYTKPEFIATVFTGEVVTANTLQQYQQPSPDRGWDDTMNALRGTPEHTPLYFMLSRLWTDLVGHSVAKMRLLTAIFSALALPCLFWLCRELFAAPVVAWIAVALVAISPLHILYAQEARPYSLISLLFLLSSAILLRSLRIERQTNQQADQQTDQFVDRQTNQRLSWLLYGVTILAGVYTHLLFSLVVIAQGVYVLLSEQVIEKRKLSRSAVYYLIAAGTTFLLLTPWLVLLFNNLEQVRESTVSLGRANSLSNILDTWFLHASRIFVDRELGPLNGVFVLLSFYSLFFAWRKAPKRAWLFLIAVVAVTFLPLAIPDVLLGGRRSLRIRYLFPAILSIQMAVAFLFAMQAVWVRKWWQRSWQLALGVIVAISISANIASSQATVWWSKSVPRSSYYIPVSEIVNQTENPLILSDGPVTDTLAFTRYLKPEVRFQLARTPRRLTVAEGYDPVFLLNPSRRLRNRITNQGYELTPVYEDRNAGGGNNVHPLWEAKRMGNGLEQSGED
jgi:uncharacterized membrane protein